MDQMDPAHRDPAAGGNAAPGDAAPGAAAGGDPSLASLAGAYWQAYLEANPLFASAVGEVGHDDRLPDHSPEGRAATRAGLARLVDRLDALDRDRAWAAGDAVTLSALRASIRADLADLDTGLRDWNVDPLEGVPAELLLVPDYQRLSQPADGRAMVDRWRAMGPWTDRHLASLRRSLAEGRVASEPPVRRTIGILAGLLARPAEDWPLLAPLAHLDALEGWSATERRRLAEDLRSAVEDEVRPAFARLHEALVTEILPAARPADRAGMGHVPGGPEGYRALVRVHTSLDATPEALHRLGLEEIDRIDAELAELAGRTVGAATLREALAALRTDPSLHFATRDEVHRAATDSLARANEAVPAWFGRLPAARCEVVRMAPHEEADSTIAYYRQPAADGSRPGQYFVNTSEPGTRPRYEAQVLAFHESVPGHHLQIAIGQELPLPAFRRHLGPTAFFEGWGLYTERLADEMGLYAGDLDRVGVLSFDAWRAARLVVDTGLHAMGWTRARAVAFMLEHTALSPNNIENEVDRYLVLPGQALAYKTGQLELLRLREAARQRLGAAFDIRRFHDTVLGNGALPLATLREVVEAWPAAGAADTEDR